MVSRIKHGDIPDTVFLTLKTPCPKCGGKVQETYRKFKCQKCDFAIWKVVSSREFAPEEIETLISKRSVGPLMGFRSRVGKPFAAMVRLTPEFRAEFDFGRQADADGTAAKVDFSTLTPLGPAQNAAAECSSSRWPTSARTASTPSGAATFAPDASSCSDPLSPRRYRSYSRREGPIFCIDSFPGKADRFRRSWCAAQTARWGSNLRLARRELPRARLRRPRPKGPQRSRKPSPRRVRSDPPIAGGRFETRKRLRYRRPQSRAAFRRRAGRPTRSAR